jgi:stage V sporulation protein B
MSIAFPITLSSCITSLTSLADTALITNRLVSGGFSVDTAVGLYSSYTNLAIPLFNLPPALITSVGISIIPALSSSIASGDTKKAQKSFASAIRICCLLAIPAAAGISVFARPILNVLYPSEAEACAFAAPLLSLLSVAIVFSCLITVCNATLQAYMKQFLPIVSMTAGAVVKIVIEYILVGTDAGIWGAPISTLCCTFTILVINLIFITVYTPHRLEIFPIIRTMAASAVAIAVASCAYKAALFFELSMFIALLAAIVVSVLLYAVFTVVFGAVTYMDLSCVKILKPLANYLKVIKFISGKEC